MILEFGVGPMSYLLHIRTGGSPVLHQSLDLVKMAVSILRRLKQKSYRCASRRTAREEKLPRIWTSHHARRFLQPHSSGGGDARRASAALQCRCGADAAAVDGASLRILSGQLVR